MYLGISTFRVERLILGEKSKKLGKVDLERPNFALVANKSPNYSYSKKSLNFGGDPLLKGFYTGNLFLRLIFFLRF